jgi:hypothetical protein
VILTVPGQTPGPEPGNEYPMINSTHRSDQAAPRCRGGVRVGTAPGTQNRPVSPIAVAQVAFVARGRPGLLVATPVFNRGPRTLSGSLPIEAQERPEA